MASGKSLQLRNIERPRPKLIHKSWELIRRADGTVRQYRVFPGPYRSPDRAERKAGQRAKRLAAKARRQAQVRS